MSKRQTAKVHSFEPGRKPSPNAQPRGPETPYAGA